MNLPCLLPLSHGRKSSERNEEEQRKPRVGPCDHFTSPMRGSFMDHQHIFPCGFGELLKTFRKRQRLTQRQLAQQLGVNMNTLSSWELGSHLPATRGLVLELARHLALSEQETRQLLEASLIALAPHWAVPFPRNPFFTGREAI